MGASVSARKARTGEPAAGPAPPGLSERLHAFRSLGGNCEFGFVQRYGGAEPSGLLRFAYTPLDDLIHALDTDFSAYGAPGDLRIEPTDGTSYYCRSTRYNIWSNTAQPIGSIAVEALLEREYGRVAHLRRRMLEELADGSRILVRKVGPEESEADLARLARAIRRHGPSTLLYVREAGPGWRPEPVRRLADGTLEGRVRRFAPVEHASEVDLEPWLALCDAAFAARHGLPRSGLDAGPFRDVLTFPARPRQHRGRRGEAGLSIFADTLDPAAFDPEGAHTFSSWVWIPEDFAGARVYALAGREPLGWADADLAIRGRWQRVWAAGRVRPGDGRQRAGLALIGSRRDRFWSCGWRMHTGPVPRPEDPPALVIAPSFFRWLTGWRG